MRDITLRVALGMGLALCFAATSVRGQVTEAPAAPVIQPPVPAVQPGPNTGPPARSNDTLLRRERRYRLLGDNDSLLDSLLGGSESRTRRSSQRLARTPEYFGDNFIGGDMVSNTLAGNLRAELPLAAAARRAKIADHNKAYPVDRIFFNYHHFHNAQNLTRGGVLDSNDVDRFTFGFEKTLHGGQSSIELRLPVADRYTENLGDFELYGGNVGNLAVILKHLICETETRAISVGIGIDTPTGGNVFGRLPLQGVNFEVRNQSTHLLPYIGIVAAPGDFFYHGSMQLDLPLNGNEVLVDDGIASEQGVLTETALFYLDMSAGVWLYRDDCGCDYSNGSPNLTGLAGVLEYHLTTSLQQGDFFSPVIANAAFGTQGDLGISNVTLGLHAEFDYHTKLRVGFVFPISDAFNRFFDSEATVSLIRHY